MVYKHLRKYQETLSFFEREKGIVSTRKGGGYIARKKKLNGVWREEITMYIFVVHFKRE